MKTVRHLIDRRFLLLGAFLLLTSALFAQKDSTRYPLILSFYSIGTGVPGDQPVKNFVTTYRKKNKLPALNATRVGGLGREGEYALLFPLKELTAKQRKQFIAALTKALPTLKNKNEYGGINLTENEPFDASRGRVKPEAVKM